MGSENRTPDRHLGFGWGIRCCRSLLQMPSNS